MKVLVLSSFAYSLTNFRGNLLREIRAQGHEVIAVAPDHDASVGEELERSGIGFRVVPMQRARMSPLSDLRLLLSYIVLMLREQPQVVIAYTQKPIVFGGIAARLLQVPRMYVIMSGLGHVFSPDSGSGRTVRWIVSRLYRMAVLRARSIAVFNSDDRADMIDNGIISDSHRVVQVPGSGVDLSRFTEAQLPDGGASFLMVARLLRNKGILEFLEAARIVREAHPDCTFSILGHLDEQNPQGITREEMERYASEYPVEFIPGTTDVRPYLAASSVFVLPSYYREGLPRTILEAMATCRPVITTDRPGCRDAVLHGENGLVIPPRDAVALAEAMKRLARDAALIRKMARSSRKRAEEVYSDAIVNRQLLEEFDLVGRQALAPILVAAGAHDLEEGSPTPQSEAAVK